MITRTIDVNLIPGKEIKHIHLNQRDVIKSGLVFRIWNDQTRFTIPSGCTATIEGTKPDNKSFQYAATVSTAANTITANVTLQMTIVPGLVNTELRLKNSAGNDIGTCNFILDIEKGGLVDNPDISESDLGLIIEQATKQMNAAAASASEANTYKNQAKTYSDTSKSWSDVSKGYSEDSKIYRDQSKQYDDESKSWAQTSTQQADRSASYVQASKDWSKISESWAIGGTSERTGENANNSKYWSKQAESWAIGGTNTRDGENLDNSKYWSLKSKEDADRAEECKNIMETYTDIQIPQFEIDFETMILYQTNYREESQLQFSMDDDKCLYYEFVA